MFSASKGCERENVQKGRCTEEVSGRKGGTWYACGQDASFVSYVLQCMAQPQWRASQSNTSKDPFSDIIFFICLAYIISARVQSFLTSFQSLEVQGFSNILRPVTFISNVCSNNYTSQCHTYMGTGIRYCLSSILCSTNLKGGVLV